MASGVPVVLAGWIPGTARRAHVLAPPHDGAVGADDP
jgi:hypothetical protein